MIRTPDRTVHWSVGDLSRGERELVDWLRTKLASAGWRETQSEGTADLVVVWHGEPLTSDLQHRLSYLTAAGSAVLLCGPTLAALPRSSALAEEAGVLAGDWTPLHEVRVRPGPMNGWDELGLSPGTTVLPLERVLTVEKVVDDVQVLLTANITLTDHAVATYRPSTRTATFTLPGGNLEVGKVLTDGSTGTNYLRLLLLTMQRVATIKGQAPIAEVRVGLLGYGAIGAEHSRALVATQGLVLTAVCDQSEARLQEARGITPDIAFTTSADELLARDDIDLVVISTPPDSHARWALAALHAGKHVVVEKPFALSTTDADTVLTAAAERDLLAVVYQNRRFDPDFLAIRRLISEGRLGKVFHAEAFIGGYGHPCNFWHSDERVSGGAIFDWGAHVLDQLLDLIPTDVDYVTGAEHKLLWHDVSNADHSRVTIKFVDGTEVEFTHSDAAAALKPRWYILGTAGAIVGQWRTASVTARSEIGTLDEDVMLPADSPPTLYLHDNDGSVTQVSAPLAPPFGFHRQLADFFQLGMPMTVSGKQSRRVLSVMEAARTSAMNGGHPASPL
jgi:scyllo-inositol 2-dehydrogenase (NADP+)